MTLHQNVKHIRRRVVNTLQQVSRRIGKYHALQGGRGYFRGIQEGVF